MTHRTEARLFEYGEFTSHSGNTLKFKLECDAFDMEDWNSIASIIMTYQAKPFRSVEGIPRGGIPLANALRKYATGDPTHQPMLVDDVFTTGKSFIDFIDEHYPNDLMSWSYKWVVFARTPIHTTPADKLGIRALFTMP